MILSAAMHTRRAAEHGRARAVGADAEGDHVGVAIDVRGCRRDRGRAFPTGSDLEHRLVALALRIDARDHGDACRRDRSGPRRIPEPAGRPARSRLAMPMPRSLPRALCLGAALLEAVVVGQLQRHVDGSSRTRRSRSVKPSAGLERHRARRDQCCGGAARRGRCPFRAPRRRSAVR